MGNFIVVKDAERERSDFVNIDLIARIDSNEAETSVTFSDGYELKLDTQDPLIQAILLAVRPKSAGIGK